MRGMVSYIACSWYPINGNILAAIIMAVVQILTKATNHINMLLYLIKQIFKKRSNKKD